MRSHGLLIFVNHSDIPVILRPKFSSLNNFPIPMLPFKIPFFFLNLLFDFLKKRHRHRPAIVPLSKSLTKVQIVKFCALKAKLLPRGQNTWDPTFLFSFFLIRLLFSIDSEPEPLSACKINWVVVGQSERGF